ncbi:MAG: hypothetical protein HQK53_04510 [Oligoflexia bacterium]|nr:hypothetical protein [Oligoflexia bacterium]
MADKTISQAFNIHLLIILTLFLGSCSVETNAAAQREDLYPVIKKYFPSFPERLSSFTPPSGYLTEDKESIRETIGYYLPIVRNIPHNELSAWTSDSSGKKYKQYNQFVRPYFSQSDYVMRTLDPLLFKIFSLTNTGLKNAWTADQERTNLMLLIDAIINSSIHNTSPGECSFYLIKSNANIDSMSFPQNDTPVLFIEEEIAPVSKTRVFTVLNNGSGPDIKMLKRIGTQIPLKKEELLDSLQQINDNDFNDKKHNLSSAQCQQILLYGGKLSYTLKDKSELLSLVDSIFTKATTEGFGFVINNNAITKELLQYLIIFLNHLDNSISYSNEAKIWLKNLTRDVFYYTLIDEGRNIFDSNRELGISFNSEDIAAAAAHRTQSHLSSLEQFLSSSSSSSSSSSLMTGVLMNPLIETNFHCLRCLCQLLYEFGDSTEVTPLCERSFILMTKQYFAQIAAAYSSRESGFPRDTSYHFIRAAENLSMLKVLKQRFTNVATVITVDDFIECAGQVGMMECCGCGPAAASSPGAATQRPVVILTGELQPLHELLFPDNGQTAILGGRSLFFAQLSHCMYGQSNWNLISSKRDGLMESISMTGLHLPNVLRGSTPVSVLPSFQDMLSPYQADSLEYYKSSLRSDILKRSLASVKKEYNPYFAKLNNLYAVDFQKIRDKTVEELLNEETWNMDELLKVPLNNRTALIVELNKLVIATFDKKVREESSKIFYAPTHDTIVNPLLFFDRTIFESERNPGYFFPVSSASDEKEEFKSNQAQPSIVHPITLKDIVSKNARSSLFVGCTQQEQVKKLLLQAVHSKIDSGIIESSWDEHEGITVSLNTDGSKLLNVPRRYVFWISRSPRSSIPCIESFCPDFSGDEMQAINNAETTISLAQQGDLKESRRSLQTTETAVNTCFAKLDAAIEAHHQKSAVIARSGAAGAPSITEEALLQQLQEDMASANKAFRSAENALRLAKAAVEAAEKRRAEAEEEAEAEDMPPLIIPPYS